ncbi:zinc transporter ZIP13-like [Pecten maximus]|uniref:zinc transporter ZIP13-like n=1 Tax=Pecten maximus TaxID=6579 RepID=UPI001458CC11|nr:zinc transporter ZIP13-like [Pecten maximus]
MAIGGQLMLGIVIYGLLISLADGEIHRAKTNHKSGGRGSRDIDVAKENLADDMFGSQELNTWIYASLASILVGLSGILPLLVIPIDAGPALKHGAAANKLKLLLSFAVGGLLGDVFLHLLPEAWKHLNKGEHNHDGHMQVGLWVLAGIISFLLIEKIFAKEGEFDHIGDECEVETDSALQKTNSQNSKDSLRQREKGSNIKDNTKQKEISKKSSNEVSNSQPIKISGYLNLLANVIDNYTHGLAIGGSFLVSSKVGAITTFAILLHEVPHEVGDFAILLRSGFDRWNAAKAQMMTASGVFVGTITAFVAESAKSAGECTAWILPFTSGGFIYIALVTVVPDLLEEKHGRESVKQVLCLCAGICSMALVSLIH